MQPQPADLIAAILAPPPRHLGQIDAELLFVAGQYLLHYQQSGADHYKFLAPEAVRGAFATLPIDTGWLAPTVRRWGTGPRGPWVVAWQPPARHTVALIADDQAHPARLRVPLPGLVFVGLDTRYYVWATAGRAFDPEAPVCLGPLPNVHPDGRICWGDNSPPPAAPATIQATWQLFLRSPFNGDLVAGKSRAQRSDVRVQLQTLATSRARTYPTDDLLAYSLGTGPATVTAAVRVLLDSQ